MTSKRSFSTSRSWTLRRNRSKTSLCILPAHHSSCKQDPRCTYNSGLPGCRGQGTILSAPRRAAPRAQAMAKIHQSRTQVKRGWKIFSGSRMKLNIWMENVIRSDNDWVKGVRQSCDAQIILHLDSALRFQYPIPRHTPHDNSVRLDPKTSKSVNPYPMLGCTPLRSFCFSKVQEWHQTCGWCAELPFTEQRGKINTAPPGIRVIDVAAMKIVSAPENCVYVALSYVWGQIADPIRATKANREVMEMNNGLRKLNIPRTIREALIVVESLGFRYFWVDSLCIIQDDPEYQMQQIKAMD
jgi:hypothetical protein